MRKSPLALLLSLICLFSSHNEIQAQGHPPTDSLRQRAAASVGKEKHDLLMRIAMSTNDIADWDATLNDAIDRCDTPAICRSRLNRIQCLFNFYSVDSAIIEARESLPFILNAKQYSFYFSTYNTFISGLFKQRRFDEAREEATTMFETAQQVKQPVGMTMALQVQGSMYYKLGLYDQALTSLEKGQIKEARRLLDEAARFIHPQIPANAYEHFYEARRELRKMTGDYQRAIKDMDILLAAHEGDLSFYMDDLLKKAELLAHSGDPRSCISLYHTYIQVKDSVNRLDIASRMDQLRTIYEVDRLNQERQYARNWMFAAFTGCLLLFLLLAGYIIYSQRLKAKNQVLYRRIQEQIRQENKAVETIKQIPENDLSRELRLFINLNELLEKEKLYTDPTLNRDDLAQRLGTNRTYLMEAVRTYGGNMTVREYIYDFRLKHAAELLSSPSALSIDQICYDSGFASRSVFYRLFRQSYGLSPNEYRKLAEKEKEN